MASVRQVLVWLCVLPVCVAEMTGVKTYLVSHMCGQAFDFSLKHVDAAIFLPGWAISDCTVTIAAPTGYRLAIKFLHLDLDCEDQTVSLAQGALGNVTLVNVCGSTPLTDYVTSDRKVQLTFDTPYQNEAAFKVMFTAFHTDECTSSDFECNNGRCIDYSLYCNDLDNCGDNSDYCYRDYNWWIYMVVGIVVFIIIVVAIIGISCCCCSCCRKRQPGHIIKPVDQQPAVQYHAGNQPPPQGYPNNPPPAYTTHSAYPPSQAALYPSQPSGYPPPQEAYPPGPGWQPPQGGAPAATAPPQYQDTDMKM